MLNMVYISACLIPNRKLKMHTYCRKPFETLFCFTIVSLFLEFKSLNNDLLLPSNLLDQTHFNLTCIRLKRTCIANDQCSIIIFCCNKFCEYPFYKIFATF